MKLLKIQPITGVLSRPFVRSFGVAMAIVLMASQWTLQAAPLQEEAEGEDGVIAVQEIVDFGFGGGQGHSRNYLKAVKKLDVLLQLNMQIQQLKTVCGIEEGQARKLKVAAKGVAQRQSEKWAKEMDQFQMWADAGVGNEAEGEDKKKDKEEEDLKLEDIDLNKLDPNVLQWLSIDVTGEMANNNPMGDKLWQRAVKSVLTDTQREKLKAYKTAKEKKVLDATVEFFARIYGTQLMLDDKQQDEFAKVIREQLADRPAPASLDSTYETLMHVASIPQSKFAKFLSKDQIKRFKILMGPYGGGWGNGVFIEENIEFEDVEDALEQTNEDSNGDDG